MMKVIDTMQLATECIVISLIYIEKLMATSKIEIRYINWKPLVFTAILLASKFWEDINFWNVDYVDHLENMYPLKAINRMESEFLSLCNYNIYVSAEKYIHY
jgi:Cyclin, N-terminal domain